LYFIDVILPIPLKQTFTYSVTAEEASILEPGMRVAVPFGKTKIYTGLVQTLHQKAPEGYEAKSIDQILDERPIITPIQLMHWQWMATYYMCTLGEVVKAALPSAFLLESETVVTLNQATRVDE
jgi:primosomal protein N' (replication factor Y)